jgi:two-component system, cell cycle sensor histidine kinase and response regulator CckA
VTTILVADDTNESRYFLLSLFKGSGFVVVAAVNGAEALELALQSPPDLVVTDILMPIMDGFDLCRRWKTNQRLRSIPFIFYTATYTDPKDERFALSLGAERFLIKPQKPEILLQVVCEVLEHASHGPVELAPDAKPLGEDMEILRQYNQVLFRKLEQKVSQLQTEIAERERAQAALQESQARLLEAHRLAHIGIWNWDPDTDTVNWSEELYQIAGRDPQLRAPRYSEHPQVYTPESWECLDAAVSKALQTGETYHLELELIRPDGSRRWVNALGGVKRDSRGRMVGLHGTVQDITESKRVEAERLRLEEQLLASQKIEAIGRLAGGVAHDFNNLLTVILGHTMFAIEGLAPNDPLRDQLEQVKTAGDRAATLTRQLLAFSRKQLLEPQVLNLNEVVTDLEKMLRRLIGEDIDLVQALAPDLGRIKADPGQIGQVIMNLAVNARDAMPDGGKLTIETANVDIDEEYAAQHVAVTPGPHVLLAVSDNGCGMDIATQKRLFEPFFTTKAPGKGTGLGLSTVYGVTKQSGGNVWVYSELGKGTTFKVYLPRLTDDQKAQRPKTTGARPAVGSETILLVEDDEAVRAVSVRILRTAGYQVLPAANGPEALLTAADLQGEIHLLLTDVVMPQMSGSQLAEQLLRLRPGLRVLYTSGYTDEAIVHRGVLEQETKFIGKPFSAADLTRKVRDVLDDLSPPKGQ